MRLISSLSWKPLQGRPKGRAEAATNWKPPASGRDYVPQNPPPNNRLQESDSQVLRYLGPSTQERFITADAISHGGPAEQFTAPISDIPREKSARGIERSRELIKHMDDLLAKRGEKP